jgi:hypothetical protein
MSFNGFGEMSILRPGETLVAASEVFRCAYCGGMPTGKWPNCDYCGARVRRGQRIPITTISDKTQRYIEVESE